MTNTSNPYVITLLQSGYDQSDCNTVSNTNRVFPCVIHGRKFETEEQYNEELHEFLNGM